MVHLYISGTTGSGKSFLARVLVEEAAAQEGLSVVVLDPRNQSVGLLVPEDRPKILQRYPEFGMRPERARGFAFDYFAPGMPFAPPLPEDLRFLARRRSIVSFKGLDDQRRCTQAAKVLDAVFEACNAQESDRPRLLVVVDEAQLFTRRRLDDSAKAGAAQVERALDRIAREGRKFGLVLALVSQTMKDFSYELASVRQMTTTKVFLRNSDREIEYASDIIGDGRLLVQLPTGTAVAHNANWGSVRLRVRPPYSKVFELGDADTRRLIGEDKDASKTLAGEARDFFDVIKAHCGKSDQPLNMSRAAELAGISSKRRLIELTDDLERAGLIRTRVMIQRGKPRIIELVNAP
jgi:DNA helicase HerA-like ATPase